MKNKIINKVLISLLLCFAYINVSAKTIYLKECEYTDEYIKWLELSDKEKKNTSMPIMCKNNIKDKFTFVGSSISGVSVNDSKFDLRDHGMVTSVKDQQDTGACWAFATNAAIESNLLMNGLGEFDLSEAHLELATQDTYDYGRKTFSRTKNAGGNYLISQAYFMNQWGPVLEEYLPFQQLRDLYAGNTTIESSTIINSTPKFDVNTSAIVSSEEKCTEASMSDIKEYLVSDGALTAMIYMKSGSNAQKYLLYDGEAYEYADKTIDANQSVNHGVTIIGWDDTVSKDNFKGTTTQDGAFIIKNSWGEKIKFGYSLSEFKVELYDVNTEWFNESGITSATMISDEFIIVYLATYYGIDQEQVTIENDEIYIEVGDSGYQYISYDDVRICNGVFGFKDIDTEIEDHNYGYSYTGVNSYYQAYGTKVYFLNYFNKESLGNEILSEVVLYFAKPNQQYKIYFADKKTNNINDAVEIASGTSKFWGFETIKSNKLKNITSDTYSIFVELTDTENVIFPVAEKQLLPVGNGYSSYEVTKEVQFISLNAKDYSPFEDYNYVIAVNTNNETGNEVIEPDVPNNPSEEENETPTPPADDSETTTPEVSDEEEKTEETNPPQEESKEDSDKDEITTDNKIVIEPNEYNKENGVTNENVSENENVDKPLENPPKTGVYVPIFIIGFGLLIALAVKKKIANGDKVFRI